MTQPAEVHVPTAWWVGEARRDLRSHLLAGTAGLGSGKTHGALQWLYSRIAEFPEARFWFYAMPIYELIHNTVFPTARKVLSAYTLQEGRHFEIVKSPFPLIRFCTGQEIHCVSANRPDKIKSVEFCSGVMDEPGVCSKDSADRLRERCRGKGVPINQMMFIGTPEGINWFADEFDSDSIEGWDRSVDRDHRLTRVIKVGKRTTEIRLRRFRLTTFDNERFLPDGYIDQIYDTHRDNERYIQAYVLGRFVELVTGNAYNNYHPQRHDIPDIEPAPYADIDLTFDFNANPLAWVSLQELPFEEFGDRTRHAVALHNADHGVSNLEDAAVEFAAKHPPARFGNTPVRLYGDSSGHAESHKSRTTDYQALARYLRELGFQRVTIEALKFNPLETVSVEALNKRFREDDLYICKRCAALRRSLMGTRWQDGAKKLYKPAGETITHHGDGLKYWAYAKEHSASRPKGFNS